MEDIRNLYKDLIRTLALQKENYNEEELTIFSASSGTAYNGKIMVVGRAVNGWKHYLDPTSNTSIDDCIASVHNALKTENLNWVKEQWGSREKYNTKMSAFWRLSKALSAVTSPEIVFHTDSMVWTNLYKAAKEEGGNPSRRLMNVEFDLCRQILEAEIKFYKPKYVVFLTGLSWAAPFLTNANKSGTQSTWQYVEQVGIFCGSKYVVGQHPQGKPESPHLDEIINHLK